MPRAQALDTVLTPAEKQSILNVVAAERANSQTLRQHQKATFEAALTAAERAQAAQRKAQWQADWRAYPRPMHVPDPGDDRPANARQFRQSRSR